MIPINPFGRLTPIQIIKARAIGCRLAQEVLLSGRHPNGVDDLDLLDRNDVFPEIVIKWGNPVNGEKLAQAIQAADAGFYEALDDAIPEFPPMLVTVFDPEVEEETEIDLSGIRMVTRAMRRAMDPWLVVLLDDAAERWGWNAATFCAGYAFLAGPDAARRLFLPDPLKLAA